MRLHRFLDNQQETSSVVTLGNFDGLHRGHQGLIRQTVALAQQHRWRSVMLTFDPLPQEFFSTTKKPARLMRFVEKWKILQLFALDDIYLLRFNQQLASISAIEFIQEVLVNKLKAKHIVVGDDFRFGHQRQGNVALLRRETFGFKVTTHTEFQNNGHVVTPISSTLVRESLARGDFALAERLLGRPYQNIGRVIHGSRLGRQLGCPTANIPMHRPISPVHGIYVVKVDGLEQTYYGIASVGNRPAIGRDLAVLLEVHLFDFGGDLYGKRLEVTYLHKLRDEWMFDSLDALKIQIAKDCQAAREFLLGI